MNPQTGVRIRSARRGEVESLSALLKELGHPRGSDAATVHWVLSHPEMEVYVASDAVDRPVAMVTISHRPQLRLMGRIATIDELIVSPAHRRRGIGRELLRRVMERAKVLSVKRLELVVPDNADEGVKAFCSACGFAESTARVFRLGALEPKR